MFTPLVKCLVFSIFISLEVIAAPNCGTVLGPYTIPDISIVYFDPVSAMILKEIPEIQKLKPRERIPDSIFQRYTPTQIAEALVARRFALFDSKRTQTRIDFFRNTEIAMHFPTKYLDKILQSGFLNYRERGDVEKAGWEFERENGYLEVQLAKREELLTTERQSLFPKYAMVYIYDSVNIGKLDEIETYGELTAIFKPEVKLRSTWQNPWGESPAVEPGSFQKDRTFRTGFLPGETVDGWVEAHIFGPLSLSDVAEFRVPISTPMEVVEKIRRAGVAVRYYKISRGSPRGLARRPRPGI